MVTDEIEYENEEEDEPLLERDSYEYKLIKNAFKRHYEKLIYEVENDIESFENEYGHKFIRDVKKILLSYHYEGRLFTDDEYEIIKKYISMLTSHGNRYVLAFEVWGWPNRWYLNPEIWDKQTRFRYSIGFRRNDDGDIMFIDINIRKNLKKFTIEYGEFDSYTLKR